jgi:hypothetical protein
MTKKCAKSNEMLLVELRKQIAIGIEEADRGELFDGPKVFQDIRRRSRKKKAVDKSRSSQVVNKSGSRRK